MAAKRTEKDVTALLVVSMVIATEPSLDQVLERAGRWVDSYERTLGNVVAEESYEQYERDPSGTLRRMRSSAGRFRAVPLRTQRHLRSEFLLVRVDERWYGLRDVLEVNGVAVARREERLLALLAEGIPSADRLRRMRHASARFNIGSIRRDVNLPTFPLEVLHDDNRSGFAFTRAGDETIAGVRTVLVQFHETARPTLIETGAGDDVALNGRLWLEPSSGRLLRAELMTDSEADGVNSRMVVDFRRQGESDLWVPTEMSERYENDRHEVIRCKARYSRFRRFDVAVDATVGGQALDR